MDQTLEANTSNLGDPLVIPNYTYRWRADGVDILGATGATFILTQAQLGKAITLVVGYTNNFGVSQSVVSTPTNLVAGRPNSAPTIGGTPETTVAQDTLYSFRPTGGDVDSDPLVRSIRLRTSPTGPRLTPTRGV